MIIKIQELNNINQKNLNKYLFFGKNDGLKKLKIHEITSKISNEDIFKYDENQILNNPDEFFENTLTNSLFSKKKLILIQRCTDKILPIIDQILTNEIKDLTIILNSESLEKRSKLRLLFEKNEKLICVPFYPDNYDTLYRLAQNFLKEKKISLSQSNINLLIDRCSEDRVNLNNELEKIELYLKNKKQISTEDLFKISNLSDNYSFAELVDSTLAQNQKKITRIINDNHFHNEDAITLIKIMVSKLKKLLFLSEQFEENNDLDRTILQAKPPIFWKDKAIVKKQISLWKPNKIKKKLYDLTDIELQIKKNSSNALNIILDLIITTASLTNPSN